MSEILEPIIITIDDKHPHPFDFLGKKFDCSWHMCYMSYIKDCMLNKVHHLFIKFLFLLVVIGEAQKKSTIEEYKR
jgi:hypothetical protein